MVVFGYLLGLQACLPTLTELPAGEIRTLAVAPDGDYLAVGSTQGVYYYRIHDRHLIWSQRTSNVVESLAFSPEGTQLLARLSLEDFEKRFLLWRTSDGRRLSKWEMPDDLPQRTPLNWSPAGDYVLVERGVDPYLLDITLDELFSLPQEGTIIGLTGRHDAFFGSAWSADGRLLAFPTYGDAIEIWQVSQRTRRQTIHDPRTCFASGIAFNSEATQLASIAFCSGVIIWDVETGGEYLELEHYPNVGGGALVWSNDDRWLISSTEAGTVVVWDADTGEVARLLRGHTADILTLSLRPGSGTLITASENEVLEWNIETGEQLATFRGLIVTP
jgi:WD40 repeat protein